MFWPIIYTVLKTECAFVSLIFSEMNPIIDCGWMMYLGLINSFIINFTLLLLQILLINYSRLVVLDSYMIVIASLMFQL